MAERTSYPPGTFSWVDLATTDAAGAKAFYSGLFGWEAEDLPAGDAGTYSMLRLAGADVAGLHEQAADERASGVPPHWMSYVTVADVDAAAASVPGLDGMVILEPFDVLDVGREAVVQDPVGAVLALWEPRSHPGAAVVNVPGALTWNELQAKDAPAAFPFYERLLGWSFENVAEHPPYWSISNGPRRNGGVLGLTPEMSHIPPNWHPYFAVASVDEAVAAVPELGGTVLVPRTDVRAGRFAVLRDPQGAAFSAFEGEFDD